MFGFGHLNQDSLARIQNIVNGFRSYPAYSAYQIKSYLYDMHAGCHAIEISRNGQVINLFLFYPEYGGSGKIGSEAFNDYNGNHIPFNDSARYKNLLYHVAQEFPHLVR